MACAFIRDGRVLATAGDDGWLRICDVASCELVREFQVTDELSACEFSADGRLVLAGHTDGDAAHLGDGRDGRNARLAPAPCRA